ncbi:glycoside hydrolase family 13 protein [Segetibacter aerophilus]|uniref:Neopullulanase SusA n=1 Tax=Segetibacter aerophilus TaxID=670293 RepID=A0A512BHR2_9BACT|nr:glycoside hydrolase family 13 protein [Segetibacter aerophilus]GEO11483.1 neopullulanase SusA [Segetibacter aerophilus]
MRNLFALFACVLISTHISAQPNVAIKRIDPTNWWVGMKNQNLQLLVYGPGAGTLSYSISYPGIKLVKTSKVKNPNYAFLDINIAPSTKPGTCNIIGKSGTKTITRPYLLKQRDKIIKGTGVTSADFIYLVMPDRFANGDTTNDKFGDMADATVDANNPVLRHGGDLKGITDHFDYLQELGVTAIWPTPVIENDEQLKQEAPDRMQAGYHGYHFTDHYKVDRRFGGDEGYLQFSKILHQKGIKLVQDAVYNHVSDEHWMYKDQPTKDWFNNWPVYTGTTHKEQALADPHGAETDRRLLVDGWFTSFLPDLNLRNPYLANYLIQHAIWSTEMFAVDAWRIDTYKYNDPAFMNRCNQALLTEYPNMHIFGETVASNPYGLSYFVKNNVSFPFKSNLPGTLDFPLNYAIVDALKQRFGWDEGVSRLYQTLAQDGLYADPMKLVTSLDNHDMDRFLSMIGEDFERYKMGVTWLLTTRGIPSWYYGTEILMKNTRNPSDAEVRRNFPGGFPGDRDNKFTSKGRSKKENDAFDYVKKLTNYRKTTPALHSGKLVQYVPNEGIYVYFRYDNNKTIMVATNTNDKETKLETKRFSERMNGFTRARNVMTSETISNVSTLTLPAKTAIVLELVK